jgi:hypothetical protein
MNDSGSRSSFLTSSYFYGSNIPGKPVRQLLNPTGRWTLQKLIAEVTENDFAAFRFATTTEDTVTEDTVPEDTVPGDTVTKERS